MRFEREVCGRLRLCFLSDPPPEDAVAQALAEFEEQGRNQPSDVENCLTRARAIAGSGPTETGVRRKSPITNESRRLALELTKVVEVWAKRVRRGQFGASRPPFRTLARAAEWIEGQAKLPSPEVDEDRVASLDREVTKLVEVLNTECQGTRFYGLQFRTEKLKYQKSGSEWVQHLPITSGTPLGKLQAECSRMHQATGFAEDVLATYVLKGGRLEFPAAHVRARPRGYQLPDGRWLTRLEGTITINTPDLSADQLRRLHQTWQRDARKTSRRGLTEKERKFLALIRDLGDRPPKNTRNASKYWQRALQAGPRRGFQWKTVNAPMMMDLRITKKLKDENGAAQSWWRDLRPR